MNNYAEDKPIFQFDIDEEVQNLEQTEVVIKNKSSTLNKDKYWYTKLTKLDYYLIQLKERANKISEEFSNVENGYGFLLNYFEKIDRLPEYHESFEDTERFLVSNNVYYDESKGKIIIEFQIDNVGKAKKPMKQLCKLLIDQGLGIKDMKDKRVSSPIHYEPLFRNLYRGKDKEELDKHVKKVADNMVYSVKIISKISTSMTGNYKIYNISCYKLNAYDKIIYRKWSLQK